MGGGRLTAAIAALGVLALAGMACAGGAAPDLDLARYRGKVVYLDFWASWCGPCKLSFPYMNRLAAAHGGDDLVLVTVNLDRSRAKADAFLAAVNNRLPVVYDPDGALARAFAVKGMPTTVFVGRDGRVRAMRQGFLPGREAAYEAQISELLHEKP